MLLQAMKLFAASSAFTLMGLSITPVPFEAALVLAPLVGALVVGGAASGKSKA